MTGTVNITQKQGHTVGNKEPQVRNNMTTSWTAEVGIFLQYVLFVALCFHDGI